VAGHDRGPNQGVPHGFKRRSGLWPPLSQEAQCRGSACSRHNPNVGGGRSGHAVYDDGSTVGAATVATNQPLLQATEHSSRGAMSTCLCLATQRRAGDGTVTKQAHLTSKQQSRPYHTSHYDTSPHPRCRGSYWCTSPPPKLEPMEWLPLPTVRRARPWPMRPRLRAPYLHP
jgi:hypothetical protein